MRRLLTAALLGLSAAPGHAQDLCDAVGVAFPPGLELSDSTVKEWLGFIVPKPAELAWREVPWLPTLWEAVAAAHREEKPILLWAMNGHPLACT